MKIAWNIQLLTIKNVTRIFAIIFAIGILYYNYKDNYNPLENYGYNYHEQSKPNFSQYRNLETRKRVFFHYLTPYIHKENLYFQQTRNTIIHLHQQFLQTHHLTHVQISFLNVYFKIIKTFNPYKQLTWQHLIAHTDIVPNNILISYAIKNLRNSTLKRIIIKNNNPLLMRDLPKTCLDSSLILNDKHPWLSDVPCYVSTRLLLVMNNDIKNNQYQYLHYGSMTDAFADAIWTININPAYKKFRFLRTKGRLESWSHFVHDKKAMFLADPNRMYNSAYYKETL